MLANLKALRTAQGLSQRALADFVKVSQQSINQRYRAGHCRSDPHCGLLRRVHRLSCRS
ncbi:MAG: helix-turn-helix domain-containing protein [Christensenellales bacterium]